MPCQPLRLGWLTLYEGVGARRRAACVEGGVHAGSPATGYAFGREVLVYYHAVVVELVLQFLVVRAGESHLEAVVGLAYHLERGEHVFQLTFVHGYVGDAEPPFLLQMGGERTEHFRPQLFVSLVAGPGVDSLE